MDERRGGRCADENKSGYPSGRQPSCHEWEDLEYGVLAYSQKHLGVGFGEEVALITSAVLPFLQENHRGKLISMTSIVSLRQ